MLSVTTVSGGQAFSSRRTTARTSPRLAVRSKPVTGPASSSAAPLAARPQKAQLACLEPNAAGLVQPPSVKATPEMRC
eukprot:4547882-Alexandrium_andersonii.AAC.1